MHEQALAALDARGVRGTAALAEAAGLVDTGDGVTVDVAAALVLAGLGGAAEAGNGRALAAAGVGARRGESRGRCLRVTTAAVVLVRGLGRGRAEGVEAASTVTHGTRVTGPDTGLLTRRRGVAVGAVTLLHVEAVGVDVAHEVLVLGVGQARQVVVVAEVDLQVGRERLVPERGLGDGPALHRGLALGGQAGLVGLVGGQALGGGGLLLGAEVGIHVHDVAPEQVATVERGHDGVGGQHLGEGKADRGCRGGEGEEGGRLEGRLLGGGRAGAVGVRVTVDNQGRPTGNPCDPLHATGGGGGCTDVGRLGRRRELGRHLCRRGKDGEGLVRFTVLLLSTSLPDTGRGWLHRQLFSP